MTSLVALVPFAFAFPSTRAPQDLLVVQSAGLDDLLVDARDAGLRAVLERLDERLAELLAEIGEDWPLSAKAMPFAAELLTRPMSLRIGADARSTDFPWFGEQRCTRASEADARASAEIAARLASDMGMELSDPDAAGARSIAGPVPARIATRGAELSLALGAPPPDPIVLRATHMPQGVTPALVVQADCGALLGALGSSSDIQPLVGFLDALGLGAATASWSLGFDEHAGVSVLALTGCVEALQQRGLVTSARLTRESLRPIPADATFACVSAVAPLGVYRWIVAVERELGGPRGSHPTEELARFTSLVIEDDLIEPLGDTWGLYASDSTGGGGLTSLVFFAQVVDAETLGASLKQIEARLNEAARAEARGYVQVRRREHAGVELATLTFPGLPVPFEPTWALAHGWFVIGCTPGATEVALDQLAGGRPDLGAEPRFIAALPGGWEGSLSLSYVDSARFVREGYGLACLAASALTNAMRSRAVEEPLVAPALPSYATLARDVRASVSTARVVDGVLVVESRSDRSWCVNGAAAAGLASTFLGGSSALAVSSTLVAFLMPRVVEAVDSAKASKSHADIVALVQACEEYYINNGGAWPDTLEVLGEPDENGNSYLRDRESLLDLWDRPYLYAPPSAREPRPRVFTLGRDGVIGGEGEDRDLDNWAIEDGEDF